MAKRTDEDKIRSLTSDWIIYKTTWYAGHYKCTRCGNITFVAGKSKEKMKCKECHYGKYFGSIQSSGVEDSRDGPGDSTERD